jgi:hypothetical protein
MILTGKSKNSKKNLSQCHFVHQKSHCTELGVNKDRCSEKPVTSHLSYGTVPLHLLFFSSNFIVVMQSVTGKMADNSVVLKSNGHNGSCAYPVW